MKKLAFFSQRSTSRNSANTPHPFRPTLEVLESRLTPTNYPVGSVTELVAAIRAANKNSDVTNAITLTASDYQVTRPFGGRSLFGGHNGLPAITPGTLAHKKLLIDGGAGATIQRTGSHSFRLFEIDGGADVAFTNVTIAGGKATFGGGILSVGGLSLIDCTLKNNTATSFGGAINSSNTMRVEGCTLTGNKADFGGGIYHVGADLTIINSTLANNQAISGGGALVDIGDVAKLVHCTIAYNSQTSTLQNLSGGGGIYNILGTATLLDTIVASNKAGRSTSAPDIFVNGDALTARGCLIGSTFGYELSSDSSNNIQGVDPGLAAQLADNNSLTHTQTLALEAGSLAIGAGVAITAIPNDVSAVATLIKVDDASVIPTNSLIQIDDEQMIVIGKSGNTLMVTRGDNGTFPAAHTAKTGVFLATDQRGLNRPANVLSDIGAYQTQAV